MHKKMKHEGVKDNCHVCGALVTNLASHMYMVHGKDKHKFACEVCGKTFGLLRDINRHKDRLTNTFGPKSRPYVEYDVGVLFVFARGLIYLEPCAASRTESCQ